MRIAVIGATGHIGSYLIPRLVLAGHEIYAVSRGSALPYVKDSAWDQVQHVQLNRTALEQEQRFGVEIAALDCDAVIDLIGFTLASTQQLAQALRGEVQHFLHCGTIWVYPPGGRIPATESTPRAPICQYGRDKSAIESWLFEQQTAGDLPSTVIHPGHLVGDSWVPLNPAANFNSTVFTQLATGGKTFLPDDGSAMLHHVHTDDVAQAFELAIAMPEKAAGESFNIVSNASLSLREYAEGMASYFNTAPDIDYVDMEQLRGHYNEADYAATVDHLAHSSNCSNAKARLLLGFQSRYSSLEAVQSALTSLKFNPSHTA